MTDLQSGEAAIGVLNAPNRKYIWFDLPRPIWAVDRDEWLRLSRALKHGGELTGLTEEGMALVTGLQALGVAIEIDSRPNYICVAADSEEQWRQLLPPVVAIVRASYHQEGLPLRVMSYGKNVPDWHRPLLEELCGPLVN